LNGIVAANSYAVTGTMSNSMSASVVAGRQKNVGGNIVLTNGQTGPAGGYSISVVISPLSLKQRNKIQHDLPGADIGRQNGIV
jgi:hypothetical protein